MGDAIVVGLNMEKINNRLVKSVTPEEALDKIEPIAWPEGPFRRKESISNKR